MSIECAVFEGFIDYLSALTLGIISGADAIILNSVVNVNKAMSHLSRYEVINCYLDNDDAGHRVLSVLSEAFGERVIDRSTEYSQFSDFNDYLIRHNYKNGLRL